jgi:hypothetical protein
MEYHAYLVGNSRTLTCKRGVEEANCEVGTLLFTTKTKLYCPDKAQVACLIRRKTSAKHQMSSETIDYIRILIEFDWSPEQVSNVIKKCGVPVSH